jgi:hypothetical protein
VNDSHGVIHGRPFIAKPASVDEIIAGIERHLVSPANSPRALPKDPCPLRK